MYRLGLAVICYCAILAICFEHASAQPATPIDGGIGGTTADPNDSDDVLSEFDLNSSSYLKLLPPPTPLTITAKNMSPLPVDAISGDTPTIRLKHFKTEQGVTSAVFEFANPT